MSGRYANNTSVSVEKSRAEIEKTLSRYGATQFIGGWDGNQAMIGFGIEGRMIKMLLTLPDREKFRLTPHHGYQRTPEQQNTAWEKARRQKWRALALVIKAKLEAVEGEISTIEDEFMPHIVLPGGQTVGSFMRPQIQVAYDTGEMPKLLPLPEASS